MATGNFCLDVCCVQVPLTILLLSVLSALGRALDVQPLVNGFWIAADEAHPLSECKYHHPGNNLDPRKDSFNFALSRARVNIECAFGIMVHRCGILWRKLNCGLRHVSFVVMYCMKLHNFCLSESVIGLSLEGNYPKLNYKIIVTPTHNDIMSDLWSYQSRSLQLSCELVSHIPSFLM
eukprot:c8848_g1_i1.p1 GENE.c8848_g1_i1~~c8848_g1_i1.p1  ORF type:complete len:178 (+),score=22.94 c8848_g1_i1:548-1081(+)